MQFVLPLLLPHRYCLYLFVFTPKAHQFFTLNILEWKVALSWPLACVFSFGVMVCCVEGHTEVLGTRAKFETVTLPILGFIIILIMCGLSILSK